MIGTSKMRTVFVLMVVTCAASFVNAQKIKIESHRDEKADFTALRTYSWLPSPPMKPVVAPGAVTDPTLSAEVLGPHIVRAIDREMSARGFKRIEGGEADAQMVYYAALSVGMATSELGSYYQYTTGWALPALPPSTTSFEIVERGSIVIDLVRRDVKTAIWRGTVSTNVNHENTLDKRVARIDEAMARVFERFPVRPTRKR
jgi:hypothetical protein